MAPNPRIGVLALQGDTREHLEVLRRVGADVVAVRRPHELADLDGIVLPGGESTTMGKLVRAFELLAPLRAALRAGLPAYGSCAGMILLADRLLDAAPGQETLGGLDVSVRRNAFGRQVDSFESDVVWLESLGVNRVGQPHGDVVDAPVHAVFIRAPLVEDVGVGVEVLARVQGGPRDGSVVAVRSGAILATSFHPELTGDDRVHRHFVQLVRARSALGA